MATVPSASPLDPRDAGAPAVASPPAARIARPDYRQRLIARAAAAAPASSPPPDGRGRPRPDAGGAACLPTPAGADPDLAAADRPWDTPSYDPTGTWRGKRGPTPDADLRTDRSIANAKLAHRKRVARAAEQAAKRIVPVKPTADPPAPRPPVVRRPQKRRLSLGQAAYSALRVRARDLGVLLMPGKGRLSTLIRCVEGGRESFYHLIQLVALADAGSACATWWHVYTTDLPTIQQRAKASPDDICAAAGVTPKDILMEALELSLDIDADSSQLVMTMAAPTVAAASVKAAKRMRDGFEDRRMLLQAGGFVPVPKGATITVNTRAEATAAAASAESSVPKFLDDIEESRQASQAVHRQLEAGVPERVEDLVGEVVEVEKVLVGRKIG